MSFLRHRPACLALLGAMHFLLGCGSSGGGSPVGPGNDPTYDERVAAGWVSYSAGQYAAARDTFADAVDADPAPAAAYVGLGWSELDLDDPEAAHAAFANGSGRTGTVATQADLLAGWAFVWNARKTAPDNYAESNARITQAEAIAPDWVFAYRAGLDADDLGLLAAENHFALGDFASSLARVRTLDPAFDADVGTPEGQAALAGKIEALRTAE